MESEERNHLFLSGSGYVSSSSNSDSSHGEGDSRGDSSNALITQALAISSGDSYPPMESPSVETDPGVSIMFPVLLL